MITDCTVCGANPGEVCRGCHAQSRTDALVPTTRALAEVTEERDRLAAEAEGREVTAQVASARAVALRAELDAARAEVGGLRAALGQAYKDARKILHDRATAARTGPSGDTAYAICAALALEAAADAVRARGKEVAGG